MSAGAGGGGGGVGVSTGSSGVTLRAAANVGDLTTCARLLGQARCVRYSRDELGRSALHLAAGAGHGPIVRLLLQAAAPKEVDTPDGAGCTPLQRAAADGHEEVLRLLLARGADVDKQDSVHGNSALHEAAWKGYSRSVRLLAAAGASLSRANAGGFTPLHLCCQNGHNQSCRELLLAGCDPDIQNNYGDTALHTAARYGHAGVTRILISAQCRVSEQNKNGDSALHIAAAMGRRKLTRILLEAGCDKSVRNKQGETARDIALRKDLGEILGILDDCVVKKDKKNKGKKRSKSKVRFDPKNDTSVVDGIPKPKHWSPYGCHYYPDPEAFPSPRLDSLPQEPLKRGEQYYLDLAGNIRKGPVGVGYTCYCAPLFRHLEARLEKDKRELQKAQLRLGQRVAGLEQQLNRGMYGRRSERVLIHREPLESTLPRSRSLEMLDNLDRPIQTTRSMDELEKPNENPQKQRPSVKELVARLQQNCEQKQAENSESSDDDDSPLRLTQNKGPMGDSNMVTPSSVLPNYENIPSDLPRSRSGVYSPTVVNTALVDPSTSRFVLDPLAKLQEIKNRTGDGNYVRYNSVQYPRSSEDLRFQEEMYKPQYCNSDGKYYDQSVKYSEAPKYIDLNSRFAKLRVLDNKSGIEGPSRMIDSTKMFESTTRMLENPHDTADRDTNNDSGYSTKVYGSSKGNSPSLSGQIDGDCVGASSLV